MGRKHRALAGTKAAYERCGACQHSRIRHTNRGKGPCAAFSAQPALVTDQNTLPRQVRCACAGFTNREALI